MHLKPPFAFMAILALLAMHDLCVAEDTNEVLSSQDAKQTSYHPKGGNHQRDHTSDRYKLDRYKDDYNKKEDYIRHDYKMEDRYRDYDHRGHGDEHDPYYGAKDNKYNPYVHTPGTTGPITDNELGICDGENVGFFEFKYFNSSSNSSLVDIVPEPVLQSCKDYEDYTFQVGGGFYAPLCYNSTLNADGKRELVPADTDKIKYYVTVSTTGCNGLTGALVYLTEPISEGVECEMSAIAYCCKPLPSFRCDSSATSRTTGRDNLLKLTTDNRQEFAELAMAKKKAQKASGGSSL